MQIVPKRRPERIRSGSCVSSAWNSIGRPVFLASAFIISLFLPFLSAQTALEGDIRLQDLLKEQEAAPELPRGEPVPLTGPVDREHYIIGPNDQLTIGIWGGEEKIIRVSVTPEGSIIVPSVGVIPVAGMSVAEAERGVVEILGHYYKNENISLTLTGVRTIKVSLSGQVTQQGSLVATPVDRVFDAINLAGGLRQGAARRSISLERRDGTGRTLDLLHYLVHGNKEDNPLLMDGDRIHVPQKVEFVRVRGEVNGLGLEEKEPTPVGDNMFTYPKEDLSIEYRPGDTVSGIVEMAGGFAESADLSRVTVRRTTGSNRGTAFTVDLRPFSFSGADSSDIRVEPGDVIDVPLMVEYVYVTGSVNKPGAFPYEPSFRVRDYVGLAGGPDDLGSGRGWNVIDVNGKHRDVGKDEPVLPGETIVVEQRLVRKLGNLLVPFASVSTIVIAIAALQR
jgi:protein involved in polysaccharide export with SLBB domain